MLRNALLLIVLVLATRVAAMAEENTRYARFQFGNHAAIFQSAEKTLIATESTRAGDLAALYKTISGREWTTEKEAKGGVLELAFLDALAEQGWEVLQVTYREDGTVYLLKKQK